MDWLQTEKSSLHIANLLHLILIKKKKVLYQIISKYLFFHWITFLVSWGVTGMANCRCWLSVAGEVLMMLKGYMACTGCLPVVSMYSGTQKSGPFWSNFLLMLTVFRWGCSASFLLMTLPWRPDLCRCHWSVKRLTTTPVSAKSPGDFLHSNASPDLLF